MAELRIQVGKIKSNIKYLSNYFQSRNIHWSLITKVFSGDKSFLKQILTEDTIEHITSIGDSRLTSLKNLRSVNPRIKTIYIKPPAEIFAADIVEFADVSLNTSLDTIKSLNEEAIKQKIKHEIIIMIELGELREGVNRSDLIEFYEQVFEMSNIEVIGIGSNLGCMYGVEPTQDKLMQLVLYRELIMAKFNRKLNYISGGTSITLPLLEENEVPSEVNHFRIGEAAFFGVSPLRNEAFGSLETDTFLFDANIIEIEEKDMIPTGVIGDANIGHTANLDKKNENETTTKAILDFGLLDVNKDDITPLDSTIEFVGITSDMLVVDLGNNKDENSNTKYQIGDKITFKPNYMAVARLLNSKFIDKKFIE